MRSSVRIPKGGRFNVSSASKTQAADISGDARSSPAVTRARLSLALAGRMGAARWRAPEAEVAGERTQVVVGARRATARARARARRRARASTRSSGRFETRARARSPARRSAGATGSSRTASRSCCLGRGRARLARAAGCPARLRQRDLPASLPGPDAATIRARALRGVDARERRRRDQDRDHRRRRRPDAPVLRPDRLHDAAPASRRARPAYTTAKVIVARAFPPPRRDVAARGKPFDPEESGHGDARRRDRGGQREHSRPRGSASAGSRHGRYIGNYKALTDPDRRRTSGSTATRPRSSPRSRPPSPTGWT